MRKIYVIAIIVLIVVLVAVGEKMRNEEKIVEEREFSAQQSPREGMIRVSVSGREYDIDIYEYPNKKNVRPEGDMTYSDAKAACESAGKRLCTNQEWADACEDVVLNTYSYGNVFEKKRCNTLHMDRVAAPSGSKQFQDCVSPSGIADMAGNLWEWVEPAPTGTYQAKGGSYRDGELAQRCTHTFKLFEVQEPHLLFDNFGTRCCMDVEE